MYRLGKALTVALLVMAGIGLVAGAVFGIRHFTNSNKRESDLRQPFMALKEAANTEKGAGRAAELANEGNVDAAIKMLSEKRDSEGLDAASEMLLANLYVKKGMSDEAISLYDSVIAKDPQNVEALNQSVELLLREERTGIACDRMKQMLSVSPNDLAVRMKLANCLYDRKEYAEASEHYGKILALKGEDPVALQGLGHIEFYRNHVDSALGYYERAVAVNPALAESWYFIARIKYFKEDYAGSIKAIAKAIALHYPDSELRLKLAYAYEYNGQEKEAISEFKRFINEHPDYQDIENVKHHLNQLEFWESPAKSESQNLGAGPDVWGDTNAAGRGEGGPGAGGMRGALGL